MYMFIYTYHVFPENYWFQNRNINDVKGCGEKFSLQNALYVLLPSVTPKQVSFGLCCFNAEVLETKNFSQKMVAKKSWRTLVFVGALVWRAKFYTSNPFILRS